MGVFIVYTTNERDWYEGSGGAVVFWVLDLVSKSAFTMVSWAMLKFGWGDKKAEMSEKG